MRRGVPTCSIVAPTTFGLDRHGRVWTARLPVLRAGHLGDAPACGPSSIARRTSGASLLRRATSLTILSGSPRVPASWRDDSPGHRARARESSHCAGRPGWAGPRTAADMRGGADAGTRARPRTVVAGGRHCAVPATQGTGDPCPLELASVIAGFVPRAAEDRPMVAGSHLHPRCAAAGGTAVMFRTLTRARPLPGGPDEEGLPVVLRDAVVHLQEVLDDLGGGVADAVGGVVGEGQDRELRVGLREVARG